MTWTLEAFDTAIKSAEISHDGNEILTRHIANSCRRNLMKKDEQGHPLWLISKERSDSPYKIDLAMAAILSWKARMDAVARAGDSGPSVYETEGLKCI
jgi:phage terminase large subunit-like protein